MNINVEINELKRRQSELEEKYAAILSAMKSLDSLFREKSAKRGAKSETFDTTNVKL